MAFVTPFQPHGLIRTPVEQVLYNRAHIINISAGIADPKEHETVALMMAVLYSNVFTTRNNFVVSPEQPPTPTSDRRCDIVVRYLESESQNVKALCFGECKRASTSQQFSLTALEKQAVEYCNLFLEYEGLAFVHVATMAGAHIRLWSYMVGDTEMMPSWGHRAPGDWSQYKDVGDNAAAIDIEFGFAKMKRFPPTAHIGQTVDTYGHPSTAHHTAAASLQAIPSGFQSGSYTATYPITSGGATSQNVYPILGSQTQPDIQIGNEAYDDQDEEEE